jgi:hypothetical protein
MGQAVQDSIREYIKLWMMLVRECDRRGCGLVIEESDSGYWLSGNWLGTPPILDHFNALCQRLASGDYLPEMLPQTLGQLGDAAHELCFLVRGRKEPNIDHLFYLKDDAFVPHEQVAEYLRPYLQRINEWQATFLRKTDDSSNAKDPGNLSRKSGRAGKKPNSDIQARKAFIRECRAQGMRNYYEISKALQRTEAFQNDPWLEKLRKVLGDPRFNWLRAARHPRTKNTFKNKICNPKIPPINPKQP